MPFERIARDLCTSGCVALPGLIDNIILSSQLFLITLTITIILKAVSVLDVNANGFSLDVVKVMSRNADVIVTTISTACYHRNCCSVQTGTLLPSNEVMSLGYRQPADRRLLQ